MWLCDKCLYNVSNRAERCAVQRMTLITQAALAHRSPRGPRRGRASEISCRDSRVFLKAQEFNNFWPVVAIGGNQGNSQSEYGSNRLTLAFLELLMWLMRSKSRVTARPRCSPSFYNRFTLTAWLRKTFLWNETYFLGISLFSMWLKQSRLQPGPG